MSINSNIRNKIESCLKEIIKSDTSVGGGCIAEAKIIVTQSEKKYFLKTYSGSSGMFLNEANGLSELAKAKAIRIPKVILADNSFLLLEYIPSGKKPIDFFKVFGRKFARMHQQTSSRFGFFEDNYIGATPQLNISEHEEATNWATFYFNKRILPQLNFAKQNGFATNELIELVTALEGCIEEVLKGSAEPPTLLHGDLWGGNYMCDSEGSAVLIDPAVYYGHREADLAMTKMFGGFTTDFYIAYQNEYPLAKGWEFREGIYLLYHYMNHLNLFGNSYYGECIRLLKKYV